MAVVGLGVQPRDFWEMTPREFWWLYEFKFPEQKESKEKVARLKKLFDLPEARPSRGIK